VNTIGGVRSGGGVRRSGTRGPDFAEVRFRGDGMDAFGRLCITEGDSTSCVSIDLDRLILRGESIGLNSSTAVADLAS
jgi:hypothetical protein